MSISSDKRAELRLRREGDLDLPALQGAYVIYTSGSTGRPKGVVVTRRGAAHLAATLEQVLLEIRQTILTRHGKKPAVNTLRV